MNIQVDDFTVRDTVCSFDNLYTAMLKCRRNVMWKDSVAGFVKNGLVNVSDLIPVADRERQACPVLRRSNGKLKGG